MIVCLSFDDGRIDQFTNAFNILMYYGLQASFHVTTGFIDGTFREEKFGKNRKPIAKWQLVKMHENGMDVSSHGDMHITAKKDYLNSINKLKTFGIKKDKYGFSVPNSDYKIDELSNFVSSVSGCLSYVRVGRDKKCFSIINKIRFVLYHKFKIHQLFTRFNKNNLIYTPDKYLLKSLVVLKTTKCKSLISFISKYQECDCALIIMFHSIVEAPTDKWEWSTNSFNELCKFLCTSHKIKVLTLEKFLEEV